MLSTSTIIVSQARSPSPTRSLLAVLLASTALISASGLASTAMADSSCTFYVDACTVNSAGTDGTDAPAVSANNPGKDGSNGTAGSDIVLNYDDSKPLSNDGDHAPIDLWANGGRGGSGSSANALGTPFSKHRGGNGQPGQDGGGITLTLGSQTSGMGGYEVPGPAIRLLTYGGAAGGGGVASEEAGTASNGISATGGRGGDIAASIDGQWETFQDNGITAISGGGMGGNGAKSEATHNTVKFGADAGNGGDGGRIGMIVHGSVIGQYYGVNVESIGGDGGAGGKGNASDGQGGNGGNGGIGNTATLILEAGGEVASGQSDPDTGSGAIYVASIGGAGGAGGGGDDGGTAGVGGAASAAWATINGTVRTLGVPHSYGVLVQSLGGVGGAGGRSASWFDPTAGDGNRGGATGTATITGTGAHVTIGEATLSGENSAGLTAQSIGGGGGVGPDSNGWFAIGGNGGNGAAGNNAMILMDSSKVTTWGFGSPALLAQSIGGGGGKGGDATSTGAITDLTIGGTGGNGGGANDAFAGIGSGSSVQTNGDHASGLVMQSIGGGGGTGGSAYGETFSLFYGAAVSVGGDGGAGGNGGTVNQGEGLVNGGSVVTSGAESFGILAQSIGGGGGSGGASTAKSIVKSGGEFPGMSLSLSTGGSGKGGGSGNTVQVYNKGLVATQGLGAIGILSQSIGGGGGTGGDATGSSAASGGGYNLSSTVTHGGSAAAGGTGGDVTSQNGGFIFTTGEAADGMLVQSIGGGGGNGGSGDSKSSAGADKSLSLTLTMGGSGGAGGQGGDVYATNTGAIATLGDGAHGMAAQTIGGGGGRGGGAAGSSEGTITTAVNVGGSGGNGGDTYYRGSSSTVTNQGSIVTFGADSHAILAQSVGGGGGAGGKAGTSLGDDKSNGDGSNGNKANNGTLFDRIAEKFSDGYDKAMEDYDNITKVLGSVNQGLGNDATGLADDDLAGAADETAESGGETDDDNDAKKIQLNVAVGGNGGLGGAGGIMTVSNSGDVATMGKHSDAIVAQSIGGGGGKGGAASTASSGDYSGGIAIGGTTNSKDGKNKNANSDNGGQVSVTNSGQVVTVGALANGIIAQSIGGGGGIGGASSATSSGEDGKKSYALNIAVGGNAQGYWSISEKASVTNTGAIETRGHDSYGIIAQSVAGGGGMVKALATDLDNKGGSATASSSKDFAANIQLGSGAANTSRESGPAIVTTSGGGTITTSGDNAVGLLAQTVSGGGGLVQGGKPNGSTAADFMGAASRYGNVLIDDQTDTTHVSVGASITTSGAGSFGVFAQSVGGGGGIAGDLGHTMQKRRIGQSSSKQVGSGGDVEIDVASQSRVTTTGINAPAIVAQSVGGGGGWFTNDDFAYIGSSGGAGNGRQVTVNILGIVDAQGAASPGILAQSTGGEDNGGTGTGDQVKITIGQSGDNCNVDGSGCAQVWGGNGFQDDAAAIYIVDGIKDVTNPDNLTNYGYIATHDTTDGTAVFSSGATFNGQNYGFITGNVHLKNGNIVNQGSGTLTPYQAIRLGGGTLTNKGTLDLTHKAAVTTLEGDYDGEAGSRIVHGADFASGTADRIDISGDASFGGEFEIRPTTLRKGTVEIARVAGDLDLGESAQTVEGTFFTYGVAENAGSLSVTPEASMRDAAEGTGDNREAVAAHLEDLWNAGVPMDRGFAALAVVDADEATATLDMLSGQALGLIGASRYASSQQFVDGIWSGCTVSAAGRCGWGTWTGSRATMDDSSDAGGYEARAWGFHIGGAQAVADKMTVGGAIAYENLSADDRTGFGSVDGDSVQLGGFVTWAQGDWHLSGAAEIGRGWFDTDRQVTLGGIGGRATGSTASWQAGLHGRAAWHRQTNWGFIEPRLDVSLLHVRTDGFTERGASPFNLAVDKTSDTTLIVTPGIAVGRDMAMADGSTLKLSGSIGYALMSDDAWSPAATLASGVDSFEARTALPDRLLKVGLGAELVTTGNTSFSAAYRGDFGSGYDNHTAELRVNYRF